MKSTRKKKNQKKLVHRIEGLKNQYKMSHAKGIVTYVRPVKCVETGQIWTSHKALCEELGCSTSKLNVHIKFNEPIYGFHYENIV